MRINDLAKEVHQWARERGWWETERNFGEMLALVHSEVSEALEEWRNHRGLAETYYDIDDKPEGIPTELADIIIRVVDIAAAYDIDLEQVIRRKMEYNYTRPYRHGGKLA